jgi:hypothetical protein
MNEIDIRNNIYRQKELQNQAASERLIRSLKSQASDHDSLRERIGRGLIHAGEQLLKR